MEKLLPDLLLHRNVPPKSLILINDQHYRDCFFDTQSKKIVVFPRVGSFEVYFNEVLIFSKLQNHHFPKVDLLARYLARLVNQTTKSALESSAKGGDLSIEQQEITKNNVSSLHNQSIFSEICEDNRTFLNQDPNEGGFYKKPHSKDKPPNSKLFFPKMDLNDPSLDEEYMTFGSTASTKNQKIQRNNYMNSDKKPNKLVKNDRKNVVKPTKGIEPQEKAKKILTNKGPFVIINKKGIGMKRFGAPFSIFQGNVRRSLSCAKERTPKEEESINNQTFLEELKGNNTEEKFAKPPESMETNQIHQRKACNTIDASIQFSKEKFKDYMKSLEPMKNYQESQTVKNEILNNNETQTPKVESNEKGCQMSRNTKETEAQFSNNNFKAYLKTLSPMVLPKSTQTKAKKTESRETMANIKKHKRTFSEKGVQDSKLFKDNGTQNSKVFKETACQNGVEYRNVGVQEISDLKETGVQNSKVFKEQAVQDSICRFEKGVQDSIQRFDSGVQSSIKMTEIGVQNSLKMTNAKGVQNSIKMAEKGVQDSIKMASKGTQNTANVSEKGVQDSLKMAEKGVQDSKFYNDCGVGSSFKANDDKGVQKSISEMRGVGVQGPILEYRQFGVQNSMNEMKQIGVQSEKTEVRSQEIQNTVNNTNKSVQNSLVNSNKSVQNSVKNSNKSIQNSIIQNQNAEVQMSKGDMISEGVQGSLRQMVNEEVQNSIREFKELAVQNSIKEYRQSSAQNSIKEFADLGVQNSQKEVVQQGIQNSIAEFIKNEDVPQPMDETQQEKLKTEAKSVQVSQEQIIFDNKISYENKSCQVSQEFENLDGFDNINSNLIQNSPNSPKNNEVEKKYTQKSIQVSNENTKKSVSIQVSFETHPLPQTVQLKINQETQVSGTRKLPSLPVDFFKKNKPKAIMNQRYLQERSPDGIYEHGLDNQSPKFVRSLHAISPDDMVNEEKFKPFLSTKDRLKTKNSTKKDSGFEFSCNNFEIAWGDRLTKSADWRMPVFLKESKRFRKKSIIVRRSQKVVSSRNVLIVLNLDDLLLIEKMFGLENSYPGPEKISITDSLKKLTQEKFKQQVLLIGREPTGVKSIFAFNNAKELRFKVNLNKIDEVFLSDLTELNFIDFQKLKENLKKGQIKEIFYMDEDFVLGKLNDYRLVTEKSNEASKKRHKSLEMRKESVNGVILRNNLHFSKDHGLFGLTSPKNKKIEEDIHKRMETISVDRSANSLKVSKNYKELLQKELRRSDVKVLDELCAMEFPEFKKHMLEKENEMRLKKKAVLLGVKEKFMRSDDSGAEIMKRKHEERKSFTVKRE